MRSCCTRARTTPRSRTRTGTCGMAAITPPRTRTSTTGEMHPRTPAAAVASWRARERRMRWPPRRRASASCTARSASFASLRRGTEPSSPGGSSTSCPIPPLRPPSSPERRQRPRAMSAAAVPIRLHPIPKPISAHDPRDAAVHQRRPAYVGESRNRSCFRGSAVHAGERNGLTLRRRGMEGIPRHAGTPDERSRLKYRRRTCPYASGGRSSSA